ncbi:hypothetical protein CSAL01_02199 [Colletotrichum salicis]|uniref:Uncharacterized protein n=1 Tax=Colletotrichum salicis TaxID=1209931 RepID=A0A135V7H6_9PEZI|nr:hypothetical protein CSAL01_02199 [Colletotrichum salicis]
MCGYGIVTEPPFQLEFIETYRQSPKDELQSKTYLVDTNTEFGPPPGSVEQILSLGLSLTSVKILMSAEKLEKWRWVPRTAKNAWWCDTEIDNSRFTQKPACAGEEIFSELFRTMFLSGIERCNSARCRASRAAYEAAAPQCRWASFRDFMITNGLF